MGDNNICNSSLLFYKIIFSKKVLTWEIVFNIITLAPKVIYYKFINKPAHLVAGKKILNTLAPKVIYCKLINSLLT